MRKAPYKTNRKYDEYLSKVVDSINSAVQNKNDDFLLVCCGTTGTGKTSLAFHVMEEYLQDKASVDYVSLNRQDWIESLNQVGKEEQPRFCCYDEANIHKRDSLTRWNKEVIDLYLSIRGLMIFNWWNNPSLEGLDKEFITERIKGVIFIVTKDVKRPRIYYYFTKKGILKILDKYGNLKHDTLYKVRKKYCFYRGWFKPYKGKLWDDYLSMKDDRMLQKLEEMQEKWGRGDGMMSSREFRKALGVHASTVVRYEAKLLEEGKIKEGIDVVRHTTGLKYYNKECLPLFEDVARQNFERAKANQLKPRGKE